MICLFKHNLNLCNAVCVPVTFIFKSKQLGFEKIGTKWRHHYLDIFWFLYYSPIGSKCMPAHCESSVFKWISIENLFFVRIEHSFIRNNRWCGNWFRNFWNAFLCKFRPLKFLVSKGNWFHFGLFFRSAINIFFF